MKGKELKFNKLTTKISLDDFYRALAIVVQSKTKKNMSLYKPIGFSINEGDEFIVSWRKK